MRQLLSSNFSLLLFAVVPHLERRRLRMKWLLSLCVIVAVAAIGGAVYRFFYPSFRVIARSSSPDGRFECIVYECPPPGLKQSPHRYRFVLLDANGRQVVEPEETATDSAILPINGVRWSEGQVAVRFGPRYPKLVCRFSQSASHWEWVGEESVRDRDTGRSVRHDRNRMDDMHRPEADVEFPSGQNQRPEAPVVRISLLSASVGALRTGGRSVRANR